VSGIKVPIEETHAYRVDGDRVVEAREFRAFDEALAWTD
jgi:hypothetical protein